MTTSLQKRYAPGSVCWGCGPSNPHGLGLASRVEGDAVVADWTPSPRHAAFPGVLNGGIIGTLLDCHSNWTAAHAYMRATGSAEPSVTVTSEYAVRLHLPTPMDAALRLLARAAEVDGRRIAVEAELSAEGAVTATCSGVFIVVGKDHPAARGW